jgi:hypothetical protein
MLKGITIIATGHPYYGRMAYNLALSIKAVEEIPIAVIFAGRALSHLSEKQLSVFDQKIELADDVPLRSGSKLWINEYTPFKETLLLDADMLWMPQKTPSQLFQELSDVEFTAITEGYFLSDQDQDVNLSYFFWAEPREIQQVYKVDKIYQWRTEVMYFKKNARTDKIFRLAQRVYKNPKLKTLRQYAGGVADELAINVAAAVNKAVPHKYKWTPAFWHRLNGNIMPDIFTLYQYYLVSFGSNNASGAVKKFYDRIMKASAYKLGVSHVFPLHSKKEFLPERAKM